MSNLEELEQGLRHVKRLWEYETIIQGGKKPDGTLFDQPMTAEDKAWVAQKVLDSPIPWARGMAEEYASRKYPPGYVKDDED